MDEEQIKRFRLEMERRAAIGLPLTPQAQKEQDERSLPFLAEKPSDPIVAARLTELTQNFNDSKLTWRQRLLRWTAAIIRRLCFWRN